MIQRVSPKVWEIKAHYYQRKYHALCVRLATYGLEWLINPTVKEKENEKVRNLGSKATGNGSRSIEGNVLCRRAGDKRKYENI